MAQWLACSKSPIRNASPASCSAIIAVLWKHKSACIDCAISWTTCWNGSLLINISVLDWYFLISLSAFIPLHTFYLSAFPLLLPASFSTISPLFFFSTIFSFISFALWALALFIFSLAALVNVFVFHAISNNKTNARMLHFTTYIPMLRLISINWWKKVEPRN